MRQRKKTLFRNNWKDYLTFSSRERKGLYALLIIFIIQSGFNFYLNFSETRIEAGQELFFNDSVNSWMETQEMNEIQLTERNFERQSRDNPMMERKLFPFDPNTCSIKDFQLLGLDSKKATMIDKYRSRGGRFRIKSDFRKMYCITETDYTFLEPWIKLPDTFKKDLSVSIRKEFSKPILEVDLARADSNEFMKLRGIGPAFARRIVNFRTKLGGFYSREQVREVWGMTDSLYLLILPYLTLSDSTPGGLHINTIGVEELGKHPYVGFSLGKVIINYRAQHGPFSDIEKLKNVPLVTDEIFRKLAPYLVLE